MKVDLKKDRKDLYQAATTDFGEVDVPPMTFLSVDGDGDPNTTPRYRAAVEALYSCAYAVKFRLKERQAGDFVVGPLEGLWSSANPTSFARRSKEEWSWTMMLAMPSLVTAQDIADGIARAAKRRPTLPIDELEVTDLTEGRSLQIMHVGPYGDEGPVLARLHDEVMPARGLTWNGRHHEIYLSDPRRVAPEKMRTVLRQPVRPA